jgi:hypothetical protein
MRVAVHFPLMLPAFSPARSEYIALHKNVKLYFAVQYKAGSGPLLNGFASGMT